MRSGSFLNIYLVQKYNSHTIIYSFSLLQNWKICAMCKTNLICHKIKFPAHLVVVTQASKHRSERMDRWTDRQMDSGQIWVQPKQPKDLCKSYAICQCILMMTSRTSTRIRFWPFSCRPMQHDAELWAKILWANKSILKTVINVVSYFWQFNALHVWKSAKTNSPNKTEAK